jgi:hypothetical protein
MTQDQSAASEAAQRTLGYRPRPLRGMLRRNYNWLVDTGRLPPRQRSIADTADDSTVDTADDSTAATPLTAGSKQE